MQVLYRFRADAPGPATESYACLALLCCMKVGFEWHYDEMKAHWQPRAVELT